MRRSVLICGFISALSLGCKKQTPSLQTPQIASSKKPHRVFDSNRAGPITLGIPFPDDAVPSIQGLYDIYWSNGYYVPPSLRMFYLDVLDLIVFMSPKHRVYRLALGPSYRSAKGIHINSSLSELRTAYPDLELHTQTLEPSWWYRPEQMKPITPDVEMPGRATQRTKKPLKCVAKTSELKNILFYFEDCLETKSKKIEAIILVSKHTADLDHVDRFVNFEKVPPCPTTTVSNPTALAKQGDYELNRDRMGEYFARRSVQKAMPMFRQAALAGSIKAAYGYSGLIFRYVHQDVIGDPLDRPIDQGAQEGMLFLLMSLIRENDPSGRDECHEAVLNFEKPITEDLFRMDDEKPDDAGPCATRYNFEYFSISQLEALRHQARAWSKCWPK